MELQYHISPVVKLAHQRHKGKEEHRKENLHTARDVENAIQQKRKDYLGSGLELEIFVRRNQQPLEDAVFQLSQYLGAHAAYHLNQTTGKAQTEFCTEFYYYCLQLYAYGGIGDDSFDDLIRLAEVYVQDPNILSIIAEDVLPPQIARDWTDWLTENDRAPFGFITATIGAVASLLGVLSEKTA